MPTKRRPAMLALTEEDRAYLTHLARSRSARRMEVIRAQML
ncbi:MAG: hypothetical protein OWU84_03185 [Firmicutes bacterium]|nr:hypothetical protein [Bacillota bacterium]